MLPLNISSGIAGPPKIAKQEQFNPIIVTQIKQERYEKITMLAYTEQNNFIQILNFTAQALLAFANLFNAQK